MTVLTDHYLDTTDASRQKCESTKPACPRTSGDHHLFTVSLLLILIILLLPALSNAQEIRNTSLFGWEEQTRNMIKDRYHNYGGVFYDRGLYRFTTQERTREHELELISRDFTSADDYIWFYKKGNSFRTFAGSYNHGEFLHGLTIRNHIPLSDKLEIPLKFTRRHDYYSDRALLELGLVYNVSGRHYAGLSHTLTEQKPDLDAAFYYRFGSDSGGFVHLEFTFLDWSNNAVYELSRRRGDSLAELRKFEVKPYLISVKAASPVILNLRGEIVAGVQTLQESSVQGIAELDEPFSDRERTRYFGVLVEYAVPYFTAGVSFQHRFASFSRGNADMNNFGQPIDYGNYQIHNSLGFFISANYRGFYLDNWFWANYNRDNQFDNYEDRFRGEYQFYPFDFEENRIQMRNRAGYDRGSSGFLAAIEWSADYRDFLSGIVNHPSFGRVKAYDYREFYRRILSERTERLTFFTGYRFSQYFHFEIGVSINVDGDLYRGNYNRDVKFDPTRFGGGFGRLVLFW